MNAYRQSVTIHVEAVNIDRGGVPVVSGINLDVLSGEAVQLFGANGAGKSSLLQVIAGLTPPALGSVSWQVSGEDKPYKKPPPGMLSYIGHESAVKASLTALENLAFWARTYGKPVKGITRALGDAGLAELGDTLTGRFSAGQKRRLDLSRCLIAERPLWILDEPTASLDADGDALWSREIENHLGRGGCAVIASHNRLNIASRDVRLG